MRWPIIAVLGTIIFLLEVFEHPGALRQFNPVFISEVLFLEGFLIVIGLVIGWLFHIWKPKPMERRRTILVHDEGENPLSDVTVSGTWSNGTSGAPSCVTDGSGVCAINKNKLNSGVNSVTFTLDSLTHPSSQYQLADNHDPDGDGTTIVINKP